MTMRWSRLTCLSTLAVASLGFVLAGCAWGVVRDAQTGQPIVGAQVTFQDSNGQTGTVTSGTAGLYAFDAAKGQAIPAKGPVTYQVTAPGYDPRTLQRDVQYNEHDWGIWEVQSFSLSCSGCAPPPAEGFRLAVDTDPFTPGIQSSRTVPLSSAPFRIDIVLENPPAPPAAFNLDLIYDDPIILAPEVLTESGPGLDDNPDANQFALGDGWDCGSGETQPLGDRNPAVGSQGGEAYIGCLSEAGPYLFTTTGVIASVTFTPVASGTSTLYLSNVALYDEDGGRLGRCNPGSSDVLACDAGFITVQ